MKYVLENIDVTERLELDFYMEECWYTSLYIYYRYFL